MMRLPVVVLACSAVLCVVTPVLAQGRRPPAKVDPKLAEAKKAFDEGAAAYAQGNYEDAIRCWERSYELSRKPLIYESIANAYERLGDARKAHENLARWREASPAEEHDLLDARMKNLEARARREEESARKAAEGKAQREAEERAALEAQRTRAKLPGPILLGAGGAIVIAGVVLDILAETKRPGADSCKDAGGQTYCLATAKDSIKSSNTLAITGDALWIGGAVVAATGAVLLIVLRPPATKDASPGPSAYLAPMPGGVLFGGTF